MSKGKPNCASLFLHTLSISAFTIGGGYVMIPLLRERFVKKLEWIEEEELIKLAAIGQSSPGAMVVNLNVLIGYRLLGIRGAICAALGTAIPPLIILTFIFYFYDLLINNRYVSSAFRGMRAGVAAVIADIVVNLAAPYLKKEKMLYAFIMIGAFSLSWFFHFNVAVIIVISGILGALVGFVRDRRRQGT